MCAYTYKQICVCILCVFICRLYINCFGIYICLLIPLENDLKSAHVVVCLNYPCLQGRAQIILSIHLTDKDHCIVSHVSEPPCRGANRRPGITEAHGVPGPVVSILHTFRV